MSKGRKGPGRRDDDSRGAGGPPDRPSLPQRVLAFLRRYDLVILLVVGVAVAIYLGLPDDEEVGVPVPPPPTEASEPESGGGDDEPDQRERADRPASPRATFVQSCGTCHTLRAAGTEGITGPDLDEVSPSQAQVLRFIRTGSLDGVMPPNLLRGEKAREVAAYVARTAGGG